MKGISLGTGRCVVQRPGAIRVEFANKTMRWIPQSVVHEDSEVYASGHEGKVIVQEWWADKEGLSDVGKGSKR
jgi:hypothetical protein